MQKILYHSGIFLTLLASMQVLLLVLSKELRFLFEKEFLALITSIILASIIFALTFKYTQAHLSPKTEIASSILMLLSAAVLYVTIPIMLGCLWSDVYAVCSTKVILPFAAVTILAAFSNLIHLISFTKK